MQVFHIGQAMSTPFGMRPSSMRNARQTLVNNQKKQHEMTQKHQSNGLFTGIT